MISTKNCVLCYKNAVGWGGHVHKSKSEKIIAGFCEMHFEITKSISIIKGCKGCYGEWKEEMGIKGSPSEVMYIDGGWITSNG